MKRMILLFVLLLGSVNLPSLDDVDKCIEDIEYARDIHQYYIENIDRHDASVVGDVEWHMKWVESYNNTLEILYSYRTLLSYLSV